MRARARACACGCARARVRIWVCVWVGTGGGGAWAWGTGPGAWVRAHPCAKLSGSTRTSCRPSSDSVSEYLRFAIKYRRPLELAVGTKKSSSGSLQFVQLAMFGLAASRNCRPQLRPKSSKAEDEGADARTRGMCLVEVFKRRGRELAAEHRGRTGLCVLPSNLCWLRLKLRSRME